MGRLFGRKRHARYDKRVGRCLHREVPGLRQPILEELRARVHEHVPGIEEDIKWGLPRLLNVQTRQDLFRDVGVRSFGALRRSAWF
jgi:hypothetical protein